MVICSIQNSKRMSRNGNIQEVEHLQNTNYLVIESLTFSSQRKESHYPIHHPGLTSFRYLCLLEKSLFMMTSSNGNFFRVTGPLCGEFPTQRPVTRSFDLRLNKRLSKQP